MTTTTKPVRTRACFVGETLLATTWGRCRMSELARITARHDAAEAQWTTRIDSLTVRLADVDNALAQAQAASEQAQGLFETALQDLIQDYQTQSESLAVQLAAAQSACSAHLTGMLPQVYVVADDMSVSTQLARVVEAGETMQLMAVQIDEIVTAPRVVCTDGQVFVTEVGDVAASELVGQSIKRFGEDNSVATSLLVAGLVDATPSDPVAVFDVALDGEGAVRVAGHGNGPTALVRVGA